MATRRVLLCLLSGASFVGCVGDPGALAGSEGVEIASAELPLYYQSNDLWGKRDIDVCWKSSCDSASLDDEKGWVREELTGQRSWAALANIRFVGWGNCTNASTDIRIGCSTKMLCDLGAEGDATTDMELDFLSASPETKWSQCTNNGLDREACIKAVALHEFGHALGISHEQNRPDTPASCTDAPQGPNGDATWGSWDGLSIMNYCADSQFLSHIDQRGVQWLFGQRAGLDLRAGDYNGDGRDDMLCHDTIGGGKWVDLADASGEFNGTDWSADTDWCRATHATVHKGDFNDDDRTDLLCHNAQTGELWIDYADTSGRFLGTNWNRAAGWCNAETTRLFVGDFNGDGRDDILCHDNVDGELWVDLASSSGQFHGTDWNRVSEFCRLRGAELYIGKYNADARDDLLCHNMDSGQLWIDYADSAGRFMGVDWTRDASYCKLADAQLLVGDFNGDSRDDLLCHHRRSGSKFIDYADSTGRFMGEEWSAELGWCSAVTSRVSVGHFNADSRDDLLCHDIETGRKWIDYADASGRFGGTDWKRDAEWCRRSPASLL